MAGSLLILLDDIATVLDDVALLTKVAAKKTAGVLGDDLALNAHQVAGVRPTRELPVVWRVARGSAVNKALLVPAALAISWLLPGAVQPLLMLGGAYLCYEGAEKILHRLLHGAAAGRHHAAHADDAHADNDPHHATHATAPDEAGRVAGAIRTDFILSAEIIVITLGVVAGQPFATQVGVLAAIAVAMTVGVYGLVAAIVKLDDLGLLLAARPGRLPRLMGRAILAAAPWLMRGLSVAGTVAMFLVGGGIVAHGLPALHHLLHDLGGHGPLRTWLVGPLMDGLVGLVLGLALVAAAAVTRRVRGATA